MSPVKRAAAAALSSIAKKPKQTHLSNFFASKTASTKASLENDAKTESKRESSKKSIYKIFCDLDGVLCDFDAGIQQLLGRRPDELPNQGIMWSSIAKASKFYENLPWIADGQELWNAIQPLTPNILTGVPRAKKSRKEKTAWCQRELNVKINHVDMAAPKNGHEIVMGRRKAGVTNVITCWSRNKHLESGPNCVLIDDRESLASQWEEAGGIFVHHTNTARTLKELKRHGILAKEEEKEPEIEKNGATTPTPKPDSLQEPDSEKEREDSSTPHPDSPPGTP